MSKSGKTTVTSLYAVPLTSSGSTLTLSNDQAKAVKDIAKRDQAIIIAPTGAGKTVTLLHAIAQRHEKFIVACPPKVINVWPNEAGKWGLPLTVTPIVGTPAERANLLRLHADVLVVSLQNLSWLLQRNHGATGILIDELSTACGKNTAALKTKSTAKITTRYGMTATPVSENFQKLYDMFRVIDNGATFGTRKESYLNKYFIATDYKGYNLVLRADAAKQITELAAKSVVHLRYDKKHLLPPVEQIEQVFVMPKSTREQYDIMRRDLLIHHESDISIAPNLAVLTSKLRQIASGFILDEAQNVQTFDNARAQACMRYIDSLNGEKVVIIYEYTEQRIALMKLLDRAGVQAVQVYGGSKETLQEFTEGAASVLLAQKNTLSHGVDGLQHVCRNLLFYQPIWSADATEQAIGRLWRQGQQHPVSVNYLICDDTIDDVVMARVDGKAEYMKLFLQHLES